MPTTPVAVTRSPEGAILARLLEGGRPTMSAALARHILTLGFGPEDQARMADLAARNQDGGLAPDERDELAGYVRAGHVLALIQARARTKMRSLG